jgi:tRNA pseudouridine(55) synthase
MIINTTKPYGITSIEFVKEYKKKNNIKLATCVGKLDPLAKGLIKILTDNDTKLMKEFMKSSKRYTFDLVIGIDTESHDCLSNIIKIEQNNDTIQTILEKLRTFIANYNTQTIPLVSSYTVKHNGIRNPLWWFYQNGYKDIELPSKNVCIFNSQIKNIKCCDIKKIANYFIDRISSITNEKLKRDFSVERREMEWSCIRNSLSNNTHHYIISMEMSVSSGFYIRRFCHDFGKYLNSCAIAFDIVRTQIE